MPSIKKIQFEGASSKVRGCAAAWILASCAAGLGEWWRQAAAFVAPHSRAHPPPQNALAYKHYDAKAVVHGKVRLSRRRMLRCWSPRIAAVFTRSPQ